MSPFEKLFGKTAQLTVLEYLMKNKGEINYLSGIALGTGLYHSSLARVLEPLLENNIVIEILPDLRYNPLKNDKQPLPKFP
jgi:hypothetical protein